MKSGLDAMPLFLLDDLLSSQYYYKKVLLLCWFDHFLDSGVEIWQIFRCFFEKSMTTKRHSEIN